MFEAGSPPQGETGWLRTPQGKFAVVVLASGALVLLLLIVMGRSCEDPDARLSKWQVIDHFEDHRELCTRFATDVVAGRVPPHSQHQHDEFPRYVQGTTLEQMVSRIELVNNRYCYFYFAPDGDFWDGPYGLIYTPEISRPFGEPKAQSVAANWWYFKR